MHTKIDHLTHFLKHLHCDNQIITVFFIDMNDLLHQLDALHLKEKELFKQLEAMQEEKSKLVKDL
jgi:hypothetical protein